MTDINDQTVHHIARLARMHIHEKDVPQLATQLGQIIDWVETLSEVDTDDIEPMTSVAATATPRRKDEVTAGGEVQQILANGPEVINLNEGGFFVVPKVVE